MIFSLATTLVFSFGSSFFIGFDSLAIVPRSIFPTIWRSIFDLDFFSSTGTATSGTTVSATTFFFSVFSVFSGSGGGGAGLLTGYSF
jgi:hypothetical protein